MTSYNDRAFELRAPGKADAENWLGEKSSCDPWHMNADLGRSRPIDLARAIQASLLAQSLVAA